MLENKKNYLDPRWQRKRLSILNRDEFTCQVCGETKKTLHIHHLYYNYEKEPWDYDDVYLKTLCVDCHHKEHQDRIFAKFIFYELLISVSGDTMGELLCSLTYPFEDESFTNEEKALVLSKICYNEELMKKYKKEFFGKKRKKKS